MVPVGSRRASTPRIDDWYVWSDTEPPDVSSGVVFPGVQDTTWTYDKKARAWYYHRFYDFEPDLNWANPEVRAEVDKIVAFWLQLGVSGFRMDAAPFVIEDVHPDQPEPPPGVLLVERAAHPDELAAR